jgi:hypothetical protein
MSWRRTRPRRRWRTRRATRNLYGEIHWNGAQRGVSYAANGNASITLRAGSDDGHMSAFDPLGRVPLHAAATAQLSAGNGLVNASLTHGVLRVAASGGNGVVVGNTTSAINAALRSLLGGRALQLAWRMYMGPGAVSTLALTGAYIVDEPLLLPPQFALVLQDGAELRAAAATWGDGPALVVANGTAYSAVFVVAPRGGGDGGGGGRIVCEPGVAGVAAGGEGPPPAMLAVNTRRFLVDGVLVVGCGGRVHLLGGAAAELLGMAVVNASGAGVVANATYRPVLHGLVVTAAGGTGIEVGAGTNASLVSSCAVAACSGHNVAVRSGALDAFVLNNTLTLNGGAGIALYDAGAPIAAVAGHLVVDNTAVGNAGAGVLVASTSGHGRRYARVEGRAAGQQHADRQRRCRRALRRRRLGRLAAQLGTAVRPGGHGADHGVQERRCVRGV